MPDLNVEEVSLQTLLRAPGRVLIFLNGTATTPDIYRILSKHGYSEGIHNYAWGLLTTLGALPKETVQEDTGVQDAVVALDQWDEPWFKLIKNALQQFFKAQSEFLFNNLKPGKGTESVLAVETLLDRLDALEFAPERAATQEMDHKALALLSERGLKAEDRQRLRALVNKAKGLTPLSAVHPDEELRKAQVRALLEKLYLWWKEWSHMGRTFITKRKYLIRLGLVKRRSGKDINIDIDDDDDDDDDDGI